MQRTPASRNLPYSLCLFFFWFLESLSCCGLRNYLTEAFFNPQHQPYMANMLTLTLDLRELSLEKKSAQGHSAGPQQSFRLQSSHVCFLLGRSASASPCSLPQSGVHDHGPAHPRLSASSPGWALPSPGTHLARFQAPDLFWKGLPHSRDHRSFPA